MSNLVYDALFRYAQIDRRRGSSGWATLNGVCCVHNGQGRPDTRKRAGLRLTDNIAVYHCFNCKFKASWAPGRSLSKRMENLLKWTGMPNDEFKKLAFKIWQLREQEKAGQPIRVPVKLEFKEKALPAGSEPFSHWLSQPNPPQEFLDVAEYMVGRGNAVINGYDYYWSPSKEHNLNKRALIPFRWEGKTVGYTARAIYPTRDRYYSDTPPNYVFNTESIHQDNEYVILVEGPLDAVAINGVGMLGDKLTDDQADWFNRLGKTIIVMPDRENEGGALVDAALKQGWHVSFPKWDKGVKDAAQAAERYGKLFAIWSIIDAKTNNRLEINVKRKMNLK